MNKPFIQLGSRIFAVAHIVAIILHNSDDDVALWTINDPDPWTFRNGTPEAEALRGWATSALYTQRLVWESEGEHA